MAPNDEPKMDELKRLLRRLDGLDSSKSVGMGLEGPGEEQRGYVGALRGTPELDPSRSEKPSTPPRKMSAGSAAILAATAAAFLSSLAVYYVMTTDDRSATGNPQETAPSKIVPSKLQTTPAQKGSEANGTRTQVAVTGELLQRAARLRENGDLQASRELLKQAADLGSGIAALELAKSYDTGSAEGEDTSALARAWYERARALGVNETASEASAPPAR